MCVRVSTCTAAEWKTGWERLDPSLSPVNIEVGTSILYVEEGTEAVSCTVL